MYIAFLPAVSWAQKGDFTLNGKVGTLSAPAKAYLMYKAGDKQVEDSAVLQQGAFQFHGSLQGPGAVTLVLDHTGNGINRREADFKTVYLDGGVVSLQSSDSLANAAVSGSPLNDEVARYTAQMDGPKKEVNALNEEYMNSPDKKSDTAFISSLRSRFKKIKSEEDDINKTYINAHPDSYASLLALEELVSDPANESLIGPLYAHLTPSVQGTPAGKEIASRVEAMRRTAVGVIAPDFSENDTLDKPVKLSDFKGKYVLLDFWASWCMPCRAENPNVVKAYNDYKSKNFTVLSVSLDQPGKKDAWLKAIDKDGLTWTHVSDLKFWNNEVATLYGIRSIPANFLIDPTGKIVGKNLRGDDLDKKLKELLP